MDSLFSGLWSIVEWLLIIYGMHIIFHKISVAYTTLICSSRIHNIILYDNDNINVHFKTQTKIYNIKKIMKQLFSFHFDKKPKSWIIIINKIVVCTEMVLTNCKIREIKLIEATALTKIPSSPLIASHYLIINSHIMWFLIITVHLNSFLLFLLNSFFYVDNGVIK